MGTVVFWSPIHGQAGNTSNTIAAASVFALDYAYRSMITHTQLTHSTLEEMFSKTKKRKGFEDTGMDSLLRLVKSGLLKADAIQDYTETIYRHRLDLLAGTQKSRSEFIEENLKSVLLNILKVSKEKYHVIWIDAHSGIYNDTSRLLIKEADYIIVNLPQNRHVLDRFFGGEYFPEELKDKKYGILLSMYDEKSSYSKNNIKRKYKVKVPIYTIPYSTKFLDAANDQNINEFFFRATHFTKKHEEYNFIKSVREMNKDIVKQLGLDDEELRGAM